MAKHDKHKPAEDDKEESHKDEHIEAEVAESKVEADNDEQKTEETDSHEESTDARETKGSDNHQNVFKRWWHWGITHRKISIPIVIVLLLALIAAIPFTRYLVAGMFLKQAFPVVVVDAETGKPVSSANVVLDGVTVETDAEGRAELKTKVGYSDLAVTKNYYEGSSQEVLVPIKKPSSAHQVKIKAIGRAVPVTVTNKISKKPVANVTVKAVDEDSEAKTDGEGKTTLVVPADKQEVKITLSGDGFNSADATLQVTTEEVAANTFSVTPSGTIYFLSNASGNLDVVKSNLDGTDRQTVLAGTGKEDDNDTAMFASPDWKYIALLSRRDGGEYPKLFLIETEGNKVTTMDEGEATFTPYGWAGDRFVYVVNRSKKKDWEAEKYALKSFDAPTKKLTTLDETHGEGGDYVYYYYGGARKYLYEYYQTVNIFGDRIVFVKNMSYSGYSDAEANSKQASLNVVRADGSDKNTLKKYTDKSLDVRGAGFGKIRILAQQGPIHEIDEYFNGSVRTVSSGDKVQDSFYDEEYPVYLVSPSGNKTFWRKNIDGKNAFFIGDGSGENGQEIGRSQAFGIEGWFTDDYILLTKGGSEMYILPAAVNEGGIDAGLKITDFYGNHYGHGY